MVVSASPVLSVPCLPSLSGGVRLAGLVCALSPFICLPSCVSLSGGVRLSGLVCALTPFICIPSCVSLSGGVRLSGLVCLPLSPFVSLLVSLCWMVCSQGSCLPSSPHCLPSCFPLIDGASAFPRVLSPLVSLC